MKVRSRQISLTVELWSAIDKAIAETGLATASAVLEQAGRAFVKSNGIELPPSTRSEETPAKS